MNLSDMISYRPSREQIRALSTMKNTGATAADLDEMAVPSYLHWNPLIRWLMWRRYEAISELAEFSGDENALEFGCGLGVFLPSLAGNCSQAYAIDLFPAYALALCRSMKLNVIFVDSLLQLAEQSLDIIIAADVLEHVQPLEDSIMILHSRLKPGGRLIVSGPTENIAYKLGRVLAGFADKSEYHHTNIRSIHKSLIFNGFTMVKNKHLPFANLPTLFEVTAFQK